MPSLLTENQQPHLFPYQQRYLKPAKSPVLEIPRPSSSHVAEYLATNEAQQYQPHPQPHNSNNTSVHHDNNIKLPRLPSFFVLSIASVVKLGMKFGRLNLAENVCRAVIFNWFPEIHLEYWYDVGRREI